MNVKKAKGPIFDPGLCRCCGTMKRCRVLNVEYENSGQTEVYSDMIMDCYGLLLSHLDGKPSERLVCATCVMRLREAFSFRKQVLRCEEAFLQMRMLDCDNEGVAHVAQMEEATVDGAPPDTPRVKIEPADDESVGGDMLADAPDSDNAIKLETNEDSNDDDVPLLHRLNKMKRGRSPHAKVEVTVEVTPPEKKVKSNALAGKSLAAIKGKSMASAQAENMNLSGVNNVVPDRFISELFNDEHEIFDAKEYHEVAETVQNKEKIEIELDPFEDDFDDMSQTEDAPYSPMTSQTRRHYRPQEEPFAEQGTVFGIYDEKKAEVEDEFLAADAHEVYARPESDESDMFEREKSVRRGIRGETSGFGRGHPTRNRRGKHWDVGEPLQFMYTKDSDVPPEIENLVKDVKRSRQERTRVIGKRIAKTSCEAEGQIDEHESQEDDEFQDATGIYGRGTPLLGEQCRFDWFPMETFRGEEEVFQPQRTGPVRCVGSAYDAFRCYWDDTILNQIVDQTNQYADKMSTAAFLCDWYPTNAHEILCLFAFWVMLGVIRMPTIKSCFSEDPIIKTEVFRRIFSQKRYVILIRALHFVDADTAVDSFASNSDPGAISHTSRLIPILDYLNLKFQENYVMSKDIFINESLPLWKGTNFRQYVRSMARFAVITVELCESSTGYLWSFLVTTDKQSSIDSLNALKNSSVVPKLIEPLLNKGYRLFLGDRYNSPVLARYLKRNKTDCVGTLQPTHDVPVLLTEAPLDRGQFAARHSEDVCVLVWEDKTRILMLSTCHGANTAVPHVFPKPKSPKQYKPQMVLDYNKSMGGVDLKDQMLEPYLLEQNPKWYIKLFKRLLNCSIRNARILQSSEAAQNELSFRLQLVDAILANHLSLCPSDNSHSSSTINSLPTHIITHSHWPVHMTKTAYDLDTNRKNRKRCVVCLKHGKKYKSTSFMCETCQVPLCAVNCFKSFHSLSF